MLTRPPLPFLGNKAESRKYILQILETYIPTVIQENEFYIVDVFGGSGFCAYLARQVFPDIQHVHVVYNDYDNYLDRLMKIDQTNRILQKCRAIVRTPQEKRMTDAEKHAIEEIIEQEESPDIKTISTHFTYTCGWCDSYEDLKKKSAFYNRLSRDTYKTSAAEYLEDIDVIRADWEVIVNYFMDKPTLFIIDPPYLYSDKVLYNTKYWKLDKYMLLLSKIMSMEHVILFSEKGGEFSSIINSFYHDFGIKLFRDYVKHFVLNARNIGYNKRIQEEIYYQ